MEEKFVSQIKHNPRAFYAYAKRFQKTFSGVGPIINKYGFIITDPAEIAEIQKEQYEKVFSKPKPEMKINDPQNFSRPQKTQKYSMFILITWL